MASAASPCQVSPRTRVQGNRQRPHTARSLNATIIVAAHHPPGAASSGSSARPQRSTQNRLPENRAPLQHRVDRTSALQRRDTRCTSTRPSRDRWWARSRPRKGSPLRSDHASGVALALTGSSTEPKAGSCVMVRATMARGMSAVATALDGAYGRHHRTRMRFGTDHPRSMLGTIG